MVDWERERERERERKREREREDELAKKKPITVKLGEGVDVELFMGCLEKKKTITM